MGLSRRQFTKEVKLAAVRRLEQGVSIAEAARAMEVNPNVLHLWRREFRQGPGNAFPGKWKATLVGGADRGVGAEGRSTSPGDRFLKGCLQLIEEQRMLQALTGNPRSAGRSKRKSKRRGA